MLDIDTIDYLETILTVVQGSLRINKKCMFQLLRADFVLTENVESWLIEINSNPGLSPSTSIISKTFTTLLKDIINGLFVLIVQIISSLI